MPAPAARSLIGVVGPVRTGKSTLIKQFMEQLILPAMEPDDAQMRARDELPQSAAGRTIMTTEPKFIPENAISLQLEEGERAASGSSTAWDIWWKGPWDTRRTKSPGWSRAPGLRRRSL